MEKCCTFDVTSMPAYGWKQSIVSRNIQRYAVDSQSAVGSLYDGWKDTILSNLLVDKNVLIENDIKEDGTCCLINDNIGINDNLLRMIAVEDELRVSIILGMSPVTEGTAMVYQYKLSSDHSTRFIYYYRIDHEVRLSNDMQSVRNALANSLSDTTATHLITNIRQGIDFVIALELPSTECHDETDLILNKICKYFTERQANFISIEEQQKMNGLIPKIFTRVAAILAFTKTNTLSDICQYIRHYIFEHKSVNPLFCTLHPIKCIYPDHLSSRRIFASIDLLVIEQVEQRILPLYNRLNMIKRLFCDELSVQLLEHFKIRYTNIAEKLKQSNGMYGEVQRRLASIVLECRDQKVEFSSLDIEVKNSQYNTLHHELESLYEELVKFKIKLSFIGDLKTNYHMEYFNVADVEKSNDDQQILEGKLLSRHHQQSHHFLCSSDQLIKRFPDNHKELCHLLLKDRQSNPSLRDIFADFSYCSITLPAMKTLLQIVNTHTLPSAVVSPIKANEINILLLGETGVGKSTFINAFVNYLAFRSLEEAIFEEPIVLIPVSFLITINDQFEEREIKYGKSSSNENFTHQGESVTQHCQSYIFDIGNNIKLRIIDSPGIGDTRGIAQDDKNIQHILSYVNNLPHLNAVCILLKPNTSRLHIFFRSCFTQLFNFLGASTRDNIIFCFTNTRASFYSPGSSASLLKELLKELPNDFVPPFSKANTFCFDSESFRYLAALKATGEFLFDENQKDEFEKSWKISVKESTRLLPFIQSCPTCPMNTCHSIKHAQIIITSLIRPIIETIRNALRNILLWDTENTKYFIELQAKPIFYVASLCTACSHNIIRIDDFSIIDYSISKQMTSDGCTMCSSLTEHFPILYQLMYKKSETKGTQFYFETKDMQDCLFKRSLIFHQFLLSNHSTSQNPFLLWLDMYIREEEYLCSNDPSSVLNIKLCNGLHALRSKYIGELEEIQTNQELHNLNNIYSYIDEVLKYPMIREQMNAIRLSEIAMIKEHEYDISLQYPKMNKTKLANHLKTMNQ